MKYILAIDSGATKSEVLIYPVNEGKTTAHKIKLLKFPCINLNLQGFEESVKRLQLILKESYYLTGKGNVIAVSAGISGARDEKDRKKLSVALNKATGIKNIFILPDTTIALLAAFDSNIKNCGILISGTGSILYYRGSNGKINRIGGWGRHIGDEGSGYWIAREALSKITKHYDKMCNAEMLSMVIKKEFGIDETNIIQHVYRRGFEISKITRHVFRCAEKGDKVSKGIIKVAAKNLLSHFIPLKKQNYTIAMMGSLLTDEELLKIQLKKEVKNKFPNITLVKPEFNPVWGAVKFALENINLKNSKR